MQFSGCLILLLKLTIFYSNVVDACPHSICRCVNDDEMSADCEGEGLSDVPMFSTNLTCANLNMKYNNLTQLSNTSFLTVPGLVILDVSHNQIRSVEEDTFSSLVNLEELDLSYNDLMTLPSETFCHNPRLNSLYLNNNPLLKFPADTIFLESSSLKNLYLGYCSISAVYLETFQKLEAVSILDLSNNALQSLSESTLEPLENLKTLHIMQNQLACSCELISLLNWLSDLEVSLSITMRCSNGESFSSFLLEAKRRENCVNLKPDSEYVEGSDKPPPALARSNMTGEELSEEDDLASELEYEEETHIHNVEYADDDVPGLEDEESGLSSDVLSYVFPISGILGTAAFVFLVLVYFVAKKWIKAPEPEYESIAITTKS